MAILLPVAFDAGCRGSSSDDGNDGGASSGVRGSSGSESGGGSGGSSGEGGSTSSGAGSSSGSGGASSSGVATSCSPGTTACEACTSENCCTQETACSNDPACEILLKCLLLCGSDSTCINACGDSVGSDALSELVAALDCSNASCASACNGSGGTCGSTPTLHEDPPGSIYCNYGPDGGDLSCSGGRECCLGGATGPSTFAADVCEGVGSGCPNGGLVDAGGSPGIPVECNQVADCTANGNSGAVACCLQNATTPSVAAGCTYPRATLGSGIVCEDSPCAGGESTICSSQADCPAGKTCTPGKWKIFEVGFCL
jgi:hypothetical protein